MTSLSVTSLCLSDVNDIDVFTGSMVEPTIVCVLARQFHVVGPGDAIHTLSDVIVFH